NNTLRFGYAWLKAAVAVTSPMQKAPMFIGARQRHHILEVFPEPALILVAALFECHASLLLKSLFHLIPCLPPAAIARRLSRRAHTIPGTRHRRRRRYSKAGRPEIHPCAPSRPTGSSAF